MQPLPNVLVQAQPAEAQIVGAIVALGFLAAVIVYIVFTARWIFRDAQRRGHNAILWTVLFVGGSLFFFLLPGVFVLIIYVVARGPRKYDDKGHLLLPPQPPLGEPAAAPTWQPAPAPPAAPPVASAPRPSAPAPVSTDPGTPLSRVRCPKCQSVFQYQKAPQGLTHVKCPSCGLEGNI